MKILHISTDYCWTEVYPNLIKVLHAKGLQQEVYIPLRRKSDIGKNKLDESYDINFVYSYVLRLIMKAFYFHKIKSTFRDLTSKISLEGISLLHTHFLFTDGGVAYLIKKATGKKYITTIRNTDVNIYFKYFFHARKFGVRVMQNAEAVIFISPAYKKLILEKYVPDNLRQEIEKKSFVIPNGVNQFWIDHGLEVPKTSILPDEPLRFLFVGELSKNKNIHKSIKIIKALGQKRSVFFTIIGPKTDYADKVISLVQKNADFVRYVPPVYDKNELLSYYREAHIFIMPSKYETFGLSYIEAMSQGLPCLFSKGQGVDGHFNYGEIGYAIDPDNIPETLKEIDKIVANYPQLSKNCVKQSKRLSWSSVSEVLIGIYKSTISK